MLMWCETDSCCKSLVEKTANIWVLHGSPQKSSSPCHNGPIQSCVCMGLRTEVTFPVLMGVLWIYKISRSYRSIASSLGRDAAFFTAWARPELFDSFSFFDSFSQLLGCLSRCLPQAILMGSAAPLPLTAFLFCSQAHVAHSCSIYHGRTGTCMLQCWQMECLQRPS